jgi:hypothetical protein
MQRTSARAGCTRAHSPSLFAVTVPGNPWDTDDEGNPVSHRELVVHTIPQLTSIDSVPVTAEERAALRRDMTPERADTLARHAWDVMAPLASASGLFPGWSPVEATGAAAGTNLRYAAALWRREGGDTHVRPAVIRTGGQTMRSVRRRDGAGVAPRASPRRQ